MEKRKIVLVDDQPTYRKIMKNILSKTGRADIVGEASSGEEFLDMITVLDIDIVFMDIEMTGLNGIETTKLALEINPTLIVIGLSMYENESYVSELMGAGAKGYLLKLKNNLEIFEAILEAPDNELFFSDGLKYSGTTRTGGPRTILTVDDFESNTFIVESALGNAGYKVLKAHSGAEALVVIAANAIDLLITDFKMPGMNGMELAEKVRAMPEYSNIPILVLSSQKDEEIKRKAREAGITGWVQKPYDLKRFLRIIESALK